MVGLVIMCFVLLRPTRMYGLVLGGECGVGCTSCGNDALYLYLSNISIIDFIKCV